MFGSIRIAKIAGIEIDIHVSWLIILVLLTWTLATGWFAQQDPGWATATYWVVSLVAALLLFVSVLLHELAHSLVAKSRGIAVKNITLFIFGGASSIQQEPQSPGVEFQMAVAGPLTSFVLGGLALLLLLPFGHANAPFAAILGYLALANILLGAFNMVPGFPLDGGRVLRAIIWKITGNLRTATRAATLVGEGVAYLMIVWGVWMVLSGELFNGIWIGLIGWFLLNGAQSANSHAVLESTFKGVTVREVMNTSPVTAAARMPVQDLVHDLLLPRGLRSAFVMRDEQLAGLITLADIRHLPREQWGQTTLEQAMTPVERLHVVTPQQSLNDVLSLMAGQDINQLPVLQDGRLVGVLSREDLIRFMDVRRGLGLSGAGKGTPRPAPAGPHVGVGSSVDTLATNLSTVARNAEK